MKWIVTYFTLIMLMLCFVAIAWHVGAKSNISALDVRCHNLSLALGEFVWLNNSVCIGHIARGGVFVCVGYVKTFLNSRDSTDSLCSTLRKNYLWVFVRMLVLCKIVHVICFYFCRELVTKWIMLLVCDSVLEFL